MTRRVGVISLCVMLAACGQHKDARTAEQIVALMKASYAATTVYRDSGVVFNDEPLPWIIFKSLFGMRSLEHFSTELDRRHNSMAFVYQSVKVTGSPEAMPERLIAMRPVSKGVSSFAPSLLLGATPQWSSLARSEDKSVHSVDCYVIHATDRHRVESTLWIEKKRLILRRVRQKIPFETGSYFKTFDYQNVEMQ